LSQKPFLASEN